MPAVFAVKSQVRGRFQLAQAEDLGPGGITLIRPKDSPLGAGTSIGLCFALPGTDAVLRLQGVVVSDRSGTSFRRTGIRFVALAVDLEQQISEFCQAQTLPDLLAAVVA